MITMRQFVYLLFVILIMVACHDMKVGFLEYENASYSEDTLIIKKELDPEEDADRIKFEYNWVSLPIEGIKGTQPIFMSIYSVKSDDGNIEKFLEETNVRGNGTFDVPFENEIPAGTYTVSLKVENEDHCGILRDIFIVIVQ